MKLCAGCGHFVCRCHQVPAPIEDQPVINTFAKQESLPTDPGFRFSFRVIPAARSHAHGHGGRRRNRANNSRRRAMYRGMVSQ